MDVHKLRHAIGAASPASANGEPGLAATRAYVNAAFMSGSSSAKLLRISTEIVESETRFSASGVNRTILFFGSARSLSSAALAAKRAAAAPGSPAAAALARVAWMAPVHDAVTELARRLAAWSLARVGPDGRLPYAVATGGGPGMMEAANEGAARVPGALTLGAGIALPFEAVLNAHVTPELAFEYNYFFVRKFAMVQPCRAFVVAPGGYGSFDELFEVLTLLQCGKIAQGHLLPVVLFGPAAFWRRVVDWDALTELGVVSPGDVERLFFTDSVDAAFEHVTGRLLAWEAAAEADVRAAAADADALRATLSAPAAAFLERSAAAVAAARGAGGAGARHEPFLAAPEAPTPGGTQDVSPPAAATLSPLAVYNVTGAAGAGAPAAPAAPTVATGARGAAGAPAAAPALPPAPPRSPAGPAGPAGAAAGATARPRSAEAAAAAAAAAMPTVHRVHATGFAAAADRSAHTAPASALWPATGAAGKKQP